jgi:AcrR family transcriptional regulator
MPKRHYVSSVRATAAAEKRDRVIQAATTLLRENNSIAAFSLDAVAKAAGVTRLTVYNQFGSRRGLLEAVFDEIARQGGLSRIEQAMTMPDPGMALERLVEIFCHFWSWDSAIGRLQQEMSVDPELARALIERNERRRTTLAVVVARAAGPAASSHARQDAVDMIFTLTSYSTFATLCSNRTTDETCTLIKSACSRALDPVRG